MHNLDEMRRFLDKAGQTQLPLGVKKALGEFQERLKGLASRQRLRIAVVGEFNAGKSTLLNKLLGANYLATGNLPCTPVPVVIMYGADPTLTMRIRSSAGIKEETRPWGELKELSHAGWSIEGLCEIQVTVPSAFLRDHGIELIDTPGNNAAGQEEHARLANEALSSAQACLFLVYCRQPVSKTSLDFMRKAIDMRLGVGLLLTKLDVLDETERTELTMEFSERIRKLVSVGLDKVAFGTAMQEQNLSNTILGITGIQNMVSDLIRNSWVRRVSETVDQGIDHLAGEADRLLAHESTLIEENLALHNKTNFTNISGFIETCRMSAASEARHLAEWQSVVDSNLNNLFLHYSKIIDGEFSSNRDLYGRALNGETLCQVIFPQLQVSLGQLANVAFQSFISTSLDRKLKPLFERMENFSLDKSWLGAFAAQCARQMQLFRLPAAPVSYSGPVDILSINQLHESAQTALEAMIKTFRANANSGVLELMGIFNKSMGQLARRFEDVLQEWLKENSDAAEAYKAQLKSLADLRTQLKTVQDLPSGVAKSAA